MKSLIDTSVLVSGMIAGHEHHERSLALLQSVQKGKIKGVVSLHSLAECYAVLTSIPVTPMIPPAEAEYLIHQNIGSRFQLIALSLKDYRQALKMVSNRQLRSGSIFDALIYQAGRKGGVKAVYTWNLKDFTRLADPEVKVLEP